MFVLFGLAACGEKEAPPEAEAPPESTEAPAAPDVSYPEGVAEIMVNADGMSFSYNGHVISSTDLEKYKSGEGDYAADVTLGDKLAEGKLEGAEESFKALIAEGHATEDTTFGDAEAMLYGFKDLKELIKFVDGVFDAIKSDPAF